MPKVKAYKRLRISRNKESGREDQYGFYKPFGVMWRKSQSHDFSVQFLKRTSALHDANVTDAEITSNSTPTVLVQRINLRDFSRLANKGVPNNACEHEVFFLQAMLR